MFPRPLFILLIFIFCVFKGASGQSHSDIFILQEEHTIRSLGLAGSFTGISNDASSLHYNPAGISQIKFGGVNFRKNSFPENWSWGSEAFMKSLSTTFFIQDVGYFGFDFTYLNTGPTLYSDPFGNTLGIYVDKEWSFLLGYAYNYNDKLSIGASVKIVHIDLNPYTVGINNKISSSSLAFDIGLLYKNIFPELCISDNYFNFSKEKYFRHRTSKGPSFGISIRNIGPNIEYIGKFDEPLPQQLRIGFGWLLIDTDLIGIQVSSDVRKSLISRNESGKADAFYKSLFTSWQNFSFNQLVYSHGIEVTVLYFFTIRYGYFKESQKYGGRNYKTYGISLGPETLRLNASYISSEYYKLSLNKIQFGLSFVY